MNSRIVDMKMFIYSIANFSVTNHLYTPQEEEEDSGTTSLHLMGFLPMG